MDRVEMWWNKRTLEAKVKDLIVVVLFLVVGQLTLVEVREIKRGKIIKQYYVSNKLYVLLNITFTLLYGLCELIWIIDLNLPAERKK